MPIRQVTFGDTAKICNAEPTSAKAKALAKSAKGTKSISSFFGKK